jgi:glycosyltransferase involved in cell wall biosynthesis
MRLLIISHTPHYLEGNQFSGLGHTVREIDALATCFEKIVHIAPLHLGEPPCFYRPYSTDNIRVRPILPSGGTGFLDKLFILRCFPQYIKAIKEEAQMADVVHVRCPANISFAALLWLCLSKSPRFRWVKYAGSWNPTRKEPTSYTIQRWILRNNLHQGIVTVYSFYNPSLTSEERLAAVEIQSKEMLLPVRLLFVGRLEAAKGVREIIQIAKGLERHGIPFELDLIGDGPERTALTSQIHELNLAPKIHFQGWQPRKDLDEFYKKAHFILLPSNSEGWPKVLSEAMAHGVVPLASQVGSIPQVLEITGAGFPIPATDISRYTASIIDLVEYPEKWKAFSSAGIRSAELFTYKHYLQSLEEVFTARWDLTFKFGEINP